jgi:Niemann-Pick C1 protein
LFDRPFDRNRWGSFVALYPIPVMSVALAISLTLACGLSCYKVTTDPVDLWVASGSQARQDMQYFSDNFWKFYRIEQVILVPRKGQSFNGTYVDEKNQNITHEYGGVFSQSLLTEALELQLEIEQLLAVNPRTNKQVRLPDICFQPLPGKCATQSIFTYFNNNVSKIQNSNYLAHIDICTKNPTLTGNVECMAKDGIPLIYPEASLGGFTNRQFHRSASLVITFPINNYNAAEQNEDALAWEQKFLDLLAERARDPKSNFSIAYKAEKSIEDELNRQSESDVVTIAVSYLIMFVYILLALGESGPVCSLQSSRCTLGFVGVAVVLLSVLSSLGFFFYLGIPATLIIVEVIPFLVLAVGVDNIFILVQAFQRQPPSPHLPLHVEIGQLVGQVAPSMLLSSSSMCACFFIGAYTPMPAVQMFALYAAVALAINFFLQMTCFLAIFTLDVRRQRANRLDILCCIRLGKPVNNQATVSCAMQSSTGERDVICSPPTRSSLLHTSHCADHQAHSNSFQPTGAPPPDQVGFLYAFFRDLYSPALMNDRVRLAVMAVFAAWLCSSLIVINRVHIGLEQEVTMPDDSYMRHYFETYQEQLQVGPPVYFMIQGNGINLDDPAVQNSLCSLQDCEKTSVLKMISYWAQHESQNSMIASSPSYFLDNYIKYARNPKCCRKRSDDGNFCPSSSQHKNDTAQCVPCLEQQATMRPKGDDFYRYLPFYLQDLPNTKCILGGKAQFLPSVKLNTNHQNVTSIEGRF